MSKGIWRKRVSKYLFRYILLAQQGQLGASESGIINPSMQLASLSDLVNTLVVSTLKKLVNEDSNLT